MKDSTRNIALIGFMGAGKTSVGRVLAHLADMDFVDADNEIEKNVEMPVSRIFELHGEGHFRCLEYGFYRKISSLYNTVIATGGGAVLDERTRAILRENALVAYLATSPETIFTRIDDDSRPLLSGNSKMGEIAALMSKRDMLYRQTCHVAVNTDNLTIAACAQKVLSLTKKLG